MLCISSLNRHYKKHRSRSRYEDCREKDRERDVSKKRKKDKKERKKRHHKADKSPSKEGSGGEAAKGPPKQPPNILVGRVGRLGSVRTLGQEKKLAEAKAANSDGELIAEYEMEIDENSPDHENASQIENAAPTDASAGPGSVISATSDGKYKQEMPAKPPSLEPSIHVAEHVEEPPPPGEGEFQTVSTAAYQMPSGDTTKSTEELVKVADVQTCAQQPYDYSAYAQAGYGYAQAYNTYIQQAAAAATYGGYSMTPPGQYYPASYPTYGSYGSPYGYYTSGTAAYSTPAPATDYQQQQVRL